MSFTVSTRSDGSLFASETNRLVNRRAGMAKKPKTRVLPVRSRDAASAPLGDKLHPPGSLVLSEQVWNEIARSLKLSGQELQIVRKVFDDHTELAIAGQLRISSHTVHTHCERLYHKLAVTGRIQLVLRIINEYLALTAAPGSTLPSVCAIRTAGRCPLQRN
jgi:DNA-binding CsgD family transcriptional regulator